MHPSVATLTAVGEPGTFGSGPRSSGYISAAKSLVIGARVLAAAGADCAEAHGLVSGFAAETLLKSLLAHAGMDEKALRSGSMKHDLIELWKRAAARTPLSSAAPPDWIEKLNTFHDKPYVVRYMKGVNAYVLPRSTDVQSGLESLLQTVIQHVSSGAA